MYYFHYLSLVECIFRREKFDEIHNVQAVFKSQNDSIQAIDINLFQLDSIQFNSIHLSNPNQTKTNYYSLSNLSSNTNNYTQTYRLTYRMEVSLISEDSTLPSPGLHPPLPEMSTSSTESRHLLAQLRTLLPSPRTSGVRLPPTSTDGEYLLVLSSREPISPTLL